MARRGARRPNERVDSAFRRSIDLQHPVRRTNLNDERCLMLRVLSPIAATLIFATALGAAPGNSTPESRKGIPGQIRDTHKPTRTPKAEVGKASWYGRIFQHHMTASGEPYD